MYKEEECVKNKIYFKLFTFLRLSGVHMNNTPYFARGYY